MNILELSEQEIVRRQSLQELRQMGINPYPAAEYPTNAFSTEIRNNVESGKWVIETTPAEGEEPAAPEVLSKGKKEEEAPAADAPAKGGKK